MSKRPNPRLAKIHRSYTVKEVANLYGIHKNTVRQWVKQGLPVCDGRRPMLILGRELSAFLGQRREGNKRKCAMGEMYCLRCRVPRKPAEDLVELYPITAKIGNLMGLCGVCDGLMNRRVNMTNLPHLAVEWGITFPLVEKHIGDRDNTSLNSDFSQKDKA